MKLAARRSAAIFAVAAILAVDAQAQFGGGVFGGGSRGGWRGGNRGDSAAANRDSRNDRRAENSEATSAELIEYRLSLLEEDLKLTSDQYGSWKPFAARVREYAADIERERAHNAAMNSPSAPQLDGLQHVGQALDMARNRLTALEEIEAALKVLYQALSPEQKTLADARIRTIVAPRRPDASAGGAGNDLPNLPGPDPSRH